MRQAKCRLRPLRDPLRQWWAIARRVFERTAQSILRGALSTYTVQNTSIIRDSRDCDKFPRCPSSFREVLALRIRIHRARNGARLSIEGPPWGCWVKAESNGAARRGADSRLLRRWRPSRRVGAVLVDVAAGPVNVRKCFFIWPVQLVGWQPNG
jgi:hypothetical protein